MSDEIPQHRLAWKAIFRVYATGRAHIDAALKLENLPSLEMFEALTALNTGPTTAKALETELFLPQYAVSRLLDRMETEMLISRMPNRADQRSKTIHITDRGRSVMREQRLAYNIALAEFMGPRAKPGQLERIVTLLSLLDSDGDTG